MRIWNWTSQKSPKRKKLTARFLRPLRRANRPPARQQTRGRAPVNWRGRQILMLQLLQRESVCASQRKSRPNQMLTTLATLGCRPKDSLRKAKIAPTRMLAKLIAPIRPTIWIRVPKRPQRALSLWQVHPPKTLRSPYDKSTFCYLKARSRVVFQNII